MYGWAKGLGAVGMVGALLLIIGMMLFDVTADTGGYAFDSEDTFQYIAVLFGVLTMLQGIGFLAYGAKTKGYVDIVTGIVVLVAGAIAVLVLAEPTLEVDIGDADFSKDLFTWVFIAVAVLAIASGYYRSIAACAFGVAALILATLPLITDQIMSGKFCIVVAALVVALVGCVLFITGKKEKPVVAAIGSEDGKSEEAPAEEKTEEKAEEAPAEETQQEEAKQGEAPAEAVAAGAAAAGAVAAEAAADEEKADEAQAEADEEEPAQETPAEETQEEAPAEEEIPAEETPAEEPAEEEIPELPKMVSSRDAAVAAQKAKEASEAGAAVAAVEAADEQPKIEPAEETPAVAAAEPVPAVEAAEETPAIEAGEATPAVEAADEQPKIEAADAAPAIAAGAAVGVVAGAAVAASGEETQQEETPAEEPYVETLDGQAEGATADESGEPYVEDLGSEKSADGAVVAGAAVAGAVVAGAAVAAASSGSEEESEEKGEDDRVPTLEELGIEPETPAVDIRRACWNRGLRCRRDYGEYKIPIAFVKGKVAVFPDEGEADHTNDKALEDDGWTVFHFPWSEVTDGEAEADKVEAAVKANLKSQKGKRGKKR